MHYTHSANCHKNDVPLSAALDLVLTDQWKYTPVTLTHVSASEWEKHRSISYTDSTRGVEWTSDPALADKLPIVGYVESCTVMDPRWLLSSVVTCQISVSYFDAWMAVISSNFKRDKFDYQKMPVSLHHLVSTDGGYIPMEVAIVPIPARSSCFIQPKEAPAKTTPGFLLDYRKSDWEWVSS